MLTSSSSSTSNNPPVVMLDPSLDQKVASAEAMWLMKVAEDDFSLRSCDSTPALFQGMFQDSPTAKSFSMSRTKASYVIGEGLGPLVAAGICKALQETVSTFTFLFDETTTLQTKKQMDILLRYWAEEDGLVVTKYINSFFFSRAPADLIVTLIMQMMDDKEYDIPWHKFCCMSSDGPNINKSIYGKLNLKLKERGYKELLPFIPCTLHVVHNGFSKGIDTLSYDIPQLAFDLHSWFKKAPCKSEDFRQMAESTVIDDGSLFLRHVSTCWLTLCPTLEKILVRWDDAKKYFLTYLPSKKKEYEKSLPKNKKYLRIKKSFDTDEKETLVEIKFLIGISPIFMKYLKMMQSEGPLVHFMFGELKVMNITLMKRFMKPDVVDKCKTGSMLSELDVQKDENHLPMEKIDFGADAIKEMKDMRKEKKTACCKTLKSALVRIVTYFQKKVPLKSTLLIALQYLGPTRIKLPSSVQYIETLCKFLPHVIEESEYSHQG